MLTTDFYRKVENGLVCVKKITQLRLINYHFQMRSTDVTIYFP